MEPSSEEKKEHSFEHSFEYSFENWFKTQHPKIAPDSVASVLQLAAEGATVPFMARYRKERTGNLDETEIRAVLDTKERWDEVVKRQKFILGEIQSQGKLSPELKKSISETFSLEELEDLYLPYKKKRKTKATLAKEAGLEPLAKWIWEKGHGFETGLEAEAGTSTATLQDRALEFVSADKAIADAAQALEGAQNIIIERLSETKELRALLRTELLDKGFLRSLKTEKAKTPSKYEKYFDAADRVKVLLDPKNSHRFMALRRGSEESELSLALGDVKPDGILETEILSAFESEALSASCEEAIQTFLKKCARLALKAHVWPSVELEIYKMLKEVADRAATDVFANNVRNILLAPPFGSKSVLGVDPGIRTGCKVAVVNAAGQFVANTVIYLQSPGEKAEAVRALQSLVKTHQVSAIAIGNGTAGRETEIFVRDAVKDVMVVAVSESGASVYSASEVAKEEFPDIDLTVRGAISIARRLQDPLAELVKVDPKSIGVGQYQHDIAPATLKKSLDEVVDSCVNQVGVNLNTASKHLLAHVSGIGPSLSQSIVEHRQEKGLFKSRSDLMEIPRFSKKLFELAAGFLRISDGNQALDNTGVHPERYEALEGLAQRLGKDVKSLLGPGVEIVKSDAQLKQDLGEFTFADVVKELEKPGRDPREEFKPFEFRDDIHELKDLKLGMICPGIVTNVTNFGAFVDIGVHQDGLVHISQLADNFVKDPRDIVSPGDRVQVRVLELFLDKKQIALTMRREQKEFRPEPRNESRNDSRTEQQRPARSAHRSENPAANRNRAPHSAPGGNPAAGPRTFSRSAPSSQGASQESRGGQGRPDPRENRERDARSRDNRDRPQDRPRAQAKFANNPFSGMAELRDAFAAPRKKN